MKNKRMDTVVRLIQDINNSKKTIRWVGDIGIIEDRLAITWDGCMTNSQWDIRVPKAKITPAYYAGYRTIINGA